MFARFMAGRGFKNYSFQKNVKNGGGLKTIRFKNVKTFVLKIFADVSIFCLKLCKIFSKSDHFLIAVSMYQIKVKTALASH